VFVSLFRALRRRDSRVLLLTRTMRTTAGRKVRKAEKGRENQKPLQ
jgi:hypothetical protein